MLTITLKGDVLHVREDLFSWTKTKTTHWYYDVKLHLCSLYGKEGDPPVQPMTPEAIDWMHKYHLPRARVTE